MIMYLQKSTKKYVFLALALAILSLVVLYFVLPAQGRALVIVSSTPHNLNQAKGQVRAIRLALNEVGNTVGGHTVQLLDLDDSVGPLWNERREAANAQLAVDRKDVVAYYGPFNSGAAKISLPILNRAGLLQVSGTVTWPGLTKPGFAIGEPMKFYPRGNRHFFRVAPTDAVQGPAAALFLRGINVRSVVILNDGGVFGSGAAKLFESRARDIGMEVVKKATIGVDHISPEIISSIMQLRPDAVYVGGDDNLGLSELYLGLRSKGYLGVIIGTEWRGSNFEKNIISSDENTYTTAPGVAARDQKNIHAAQFQKLYSNFYHEDPDAYALAAYESTRAILEAIRTSDGTRAGVLAAFKNIKDFESSFGKTNFDSRGDLENNLISIFQFSKNDWVFVRAIENNL